MSSSGAAASVLTIASRSSSAFETSSSPDTAMQVCVRLCSTWMCRQSECTRGLDPSFTFLTGGAATRRRSHAGKHRRVSWFVVPKAPTVALRSGSQEPAECLRAPIGDPICPRCCGRLPGDSSPSPSQAITLGPTSERVSPKADTSSRTLLSREGRRRPRASRRSTRRRWPRAAAG
jgi:hypothetical protein